MRNSLAKLILCLAIVLQTSFLVAQNVVVTGRVNRTNTNISLLVYEDLFTWQPAEVSKSVTDGKGFFILETNVNQVMPAALKIGMDMVDFYVLPNSDFDIVVTIPENEANQSYFDRPMPKMRFRKADDKGINRQINTIDAIFTSYMLDHYVEICRGREYNYLDSIRNDIRKPLPEIKNNYVNDYMDYKLASLRTILDADGGVKVKSEYFAQKPVLYAQPAYVELFKELYRDFFFNNNSSSCFDEAFHTSTVKMMECLENDRMLSKNKQLAEMVLAYNLFKLYDERSTHKLAAKHLAYLQKSASFASNKRVVNNFLDKRNKYSNGADAPCFILRDVNGKEVKMTDYSDKMLLLQFVDKYVPMHDRHFERLKELRNQWNDTIQIITISTKENISSYSSKFKAMHIDWPLLNLGNNTELLEQYDVRMFPEYFIIKRGNKIGMAPAPAPDQFLDKYVTGLYGK